LLRPHGSPLGASQLEPLDSLGLHDSSLGASQSEPLAALGAAPGAADPAAVAGEAGSFEASQLEPLDSLGLRDSSLGTSRPEPLKVLGTLECFSPRTLGDSSQSAELTMSVWASKAIIAFRIALKEFKLGPDGPTELQLDAKAVLDGAGMEKVARRQRYQAVRLAMLRQWIADGVLRTKKVSTADLPSDIISKPVAPVGQFLRLAGIPLAGKAPSAA
jgi:hypothetical protein